MDAENPNSSTISIISNLILSLAIGVCRSHAPPYCLKPLPLTTWLNLCVCLSVCVCERARGSSTKPWLSQLQITITKRSMTSMPRGRTLSSRLWERERERLLLGVGNDSDDLMSWCLTGLCELKSNFDDEREKKGRGIFEKRNDCFLNKPRIIPSRDSRV